MTVAEEQSDLMKNILGLSHEPVGVTFHKDLPAEIEQAGLQHKYSSSGLCRCDCPSSSIAKN